MKNIKFEALNFENLKDLRRVAEIHESAPLNWNPNFVVREDRIQHMCSYLKSSQKEKPKVLNF